MPKKPAAGPRDERGVLAARILAAAREAFAETGWAGTTIRAVARAADVDPALVYHYFDSKEGLLDAATTPPARWLENVANTWATPVDDLGAALLRLMLGAWADDEIGPVLRAILQTAAHEPATREKLRRVVESQLIGVSHLDDDERELVLGVVLEEVLSWVRGLAGSQLLRALVVFDEVYGFLPPHPANPPTKRPLVALMKQARAFGVGVVIATQNPMDLDYRAL